MNVNDSQQLDCSPEDVLSLPLVDLIEMPVDCFAQLLRRSEPPADEVLEALDHVLRHKVVRKLAGDNDRAAWSAELDDFRRLVPHDRRALLDGGAKPWATRWTTLGDVIAAAADAQATRERITTTSLAHSEAVLEAIGHHPGCAQSDLARILRLGRANLSRILGVLEARRRVRRQAIGREKRVYLVADPRPTRSERRMRQSSVNVVDMASRGHQQASEWATMQ